jgi:hypothetical protein
MTLFSIQSLTQFFNLPTPDPALSLHRTAIPQIYYPMISISAQTLPIYACSAMRAIPLSPGGRPHCLAVQYVRNRT